MPFALRKPDHTTKARSPTFIREAQIKYIVCFLYYFRSAQRFALPALGRAAGRRPIEKRLRRRKMLENAAESPASGARFVGRRFDIEACNPVFQYF
jgi:hypothetical protein